MKNLFKMTICFWQNKIFLTYYLGFLCMCVHWMLWFLIYWIFEIKNFIICMTCKQLIKMKDTASIFTYMMCRKIFDPTSNHWPMGTHIVFCDFIKPRQKSWFTLSRCCLEEFHNSICCQLYPELIRPVT